MECVLLFHNPIWQLLWQYFPDVLFFLHAEQDPVAPVIANIYCEKTFIRAAQFPEVKLLQPSIHFHQLGEVYIFLYFNSHSPKNVTSETQS